MRAEVPIVNASADKLFSGLFPPGCAGYIDVRAIGGRQPSTEFIPVDDRDQLWREIRHLAKFRNIYFGVAPRTREQGTKDAVAEVHAAWVDLDASNAGGRLAGFELPPSFVVSSGTQGHHHAYWCLEEAVSPETIERVNRGLADALGGDTAAVDASRMMRMPGTCNFKHDPPVMAKLIESNGRRYELAELESALGPPETTGQDASKSMPRSDTSTPVDNVLERLEGVRESGNGWQALCPAHDDHNPSLSITEGDDGRCLLHCFRGCSTEQIVTAIGLEVSHLFVNGAKDKALAAIVVELAEKDAQLFHDERGRAFAWVPVGGHREVWAIESRRFKRWLRHKLATEHGRIANSQAINDAVELLCAKAEIDGPEQTAFVRVASHGDRSFLDLADQRWRAVEIRPGGWRIVEQPAVPFIRRGSTRPLPEPLADGSLDDLRDFFNVPDEDGWRLVVAFCVMALQAEGPFPILVLQGEKGSAKTTSARVVRALIDPATPLLRTGNPNERDLMIAASTSRIVAYDNITFVKDSFADDLCQLSTGAGFGTRALYTDDEEIVFDETRPILLNGISDIATRPDLVSRSIVLELPALDEEERVPENEFWSRFADAHPGILGAFLDTRAAVMETLPTLELERTPRMADFARVGVAVERVLGWPAGSFLDAYAGQETDALTATLDSEPLAAVLLGLIERRRAWSGTASDLFGALTHKAGDDVKRRRNWPGNAAVMSKRLKQLLPALREAGLEIEWKAIGRGAHKQRGLVINWEGGDGGDDGDGGDG